MDVGALASFAEALVGALVGALVSAFVAEAFRASSSAMSVAEPGPRTGEELFKRRTMTSIVPTSLTKSLFAFSDLGAATTCQYIANRFADVRTYLESAEGPVSSDELVVWLSLFLLPHAKVNFIVCWRCTVFGITEASSVTVALVLTVHVDE